MSSSISALPAIPQYLSDIKNESKAAANFAKSDPATQSDLAAFNKAAPGLKTPGDLLGNYRALNVVLTAYGLSSLSGQTAVVRDLLTQSPSSPTSLAHRSANPAWQGFAQAFSTWTPPPFSSSATIATVNQKYLNAQFEHDANTQTPGLGDALYFTRNMQGVSAINQIMADPTLLKVAETVAGFDPTQFGALDFDQQVRLLTPNIDFKQLATPEGVQKFAQQYLAILQFRPQATTTPATTLSLYGASTSGNSILSLFTGRSGGGNNALLSILG